jgi:hypothetical protein
VSYCRPQAPGSASFLELQGRRPPFVSMADTQPPELLLPNSSRILEANHSLEETKQLTLSHMQDGIKPSNTDNSQNNGLFESGFLLYSTWWRQRSLNQNTCDSCMEEWSALPSEEKKKWTRMYNRLLHHYDKSMTGAQPPTTALHPLAAHKDYILESGPLSLIIIITITLLLLL